MNAPPTAVNAPPRERPLLFSGEMVRALLAAEKTQTRRLIKPQPGPELGELPGQAWNSGFVDMPCPHGQPGDRLWVKETWGYPAGTLEGEERAVYKADSPAKVSLEWGWRSGRFMPRWASRITLEITNVRVERLQDISEEEAIAEGVVLAPPGAGLWLQDRGPAVNAYAATWDRINGDVATWSSNPWVWCISFSRVQP